MVTPSGIDDDLSGRTLGEFVLRERIGEGGYGAVYRCEQPQLGREAVIKVLHHRLRDNDMVTQRFTREAKLASRIDHPYAAHVYAFGVEADDGLCWIAMEMVHGTPLDRWLDARGPLPIGELVPLFERIAEVVETVHDSGIVHRDLKPSNIMVIERAGRLMPKLLDLGIAKLVDDAKAPATPVDDTPVVGMVASLTLTNAMLGSPPYMSPEQWRDPLNVGPQADLYALGVIAYEALTGRRPFVGETIPAYIELHMTGEIPPLGPGFSPQLDRFFQRALAKEAANRPANALALAEELRVAAIPVTAPPARRRVPWLVIAGAVAILAIGVIVVIATRGPNTEGAVAVVHDAALAVPVDAAPVAIAPVDAAETIAPPAKVSLHVESSPSHAEVYRLPSQVKVGVTPWDGELERTDGVAVFAIKRHGYRDGRVELDLHTGGRVRVALVPVVSSPPTQAEQRHKGEPADPFKEK